MARGFVHGAGRLSHRHHQRSHTALSEQQQQTPARAALLPEPGPSASHSVNGGLALQQLQQQQQFVAELLGGNSSDTTWRDKADFFELAAAEAAESSSFVWPASPALVINLAQHVNDWVNVSTIFEREGIPFTRLNSSCNAHGGPSDPTVPTADECAFFHLLDSSRGGDPTCPHRPPVAVSECRCNAFNTSGGVVGCALSHVRAWNTSMQQHADSPFQVIAEDDAVLYPGRAKAQLLTAVANVTRMTLGQWSTIFFSPSVPSCLPSCAPGLRRWNGIDDYNEWWTNAMATDAWTTMYVVSPRGMKNYMTVVDSEGFGVGVDSSMIDWCPPGECFTLYSGAAPVEIGVLSPSYSNAHNTIENGEGCNVFCHFPWLVYALPVAGLLLLVVIGLGIARCRRGQQQAKEAP